MREKEECFACEEREKKNAKENKEKQNKILPCGAASFGCSGHFKMFPKTTFSLHITDCLHKRSQALPKQSPEVTHPQVCTALKQNIALLLVHSLLQFIAVTPVFIQFKGRGVLTRFYRLCPLSKLSKALSCIWHWSFFPSVVQRLVL